MSDKYESLYRAENAALDQLLRRVLTESGVKPPATLSRSAGPLQILDMACGTCREAGTLAEVFRDFAGTDRDVRLVGSDIRERELEEAAVRAKANGQSRDQFEFLSGNGAQLSRHHELGRDFDITFLRHQNFWNDQPVWQRIFEQGLEKLKDDGLLILTSYFDREHALALKALERAGAELVLTRQNEASRQLDTPGKSVDRHVAVFPEEAVDPGVVRRVTRPLELQRVLPLPWRPGSPCDGDTLAVRWENI